MKVGIAYNAERVGAASAAPIAEALRSAGGEAVIFSLAEPFPPMDRLIVLGGDGAILHAAKHASALGIPLVGVNYGHVGFLTEYDRDEGVRAAHLCMREDAETLERSMLEAELGGKKAYLINELTLLRRVSDGHWRPSTGAMRANSSQTGSSSPRRRVPLPILSLRAAAS